MFEYSKLVFNQTVEDIKKLSTVLNFIIQSVYISYLIYATVVGTGILGVNIALLAISVAYLVFFSIMTAKEIKKTDAKVKKRVKEIYKISKYIIQIPTLITAIITLYTLENDHVTFSLLFTVLMIVGYLLSIILSVIIKIVEDRAKKFAVAIEADIEPLMNVVNTVKKFMGEKVEVQESDKTKAKIRAELDSKVGKIKEERSNSAPQAIDKAELKKVRKEIIGSIALKLKDKAKSKLQSLTAKKPESLPVPTEEENKETANK
jgi:hypothetical protein